MKKLLLLALLLISCMPANVPDNVPCEGSGALCQGSRNWKQHNLCGPNNTSGACVEAVRGPFVLTGVDSSEHCPNGLVVAIADTFRNSEDIDPQWTVESKEHWKMAVPAKTRLWIKDIAMEIPAGQSLFVGTDGFNHVNRSSECYVAWEGYFP